MGYWILDSAHANHPKGPRGGIGILDTGFCPRQPSQGPQGRDWDTGYWILPTPTIPRALGAGLGYWILDCAHANHPKGPRGGIGILDTGF